MCLLGTLFASPNFANPFSLFILPFKNDPWEFKMQVLKFIWLIVFSDLVLIVLDDCILKYSSSEMNEVPMLLHVVLNLIAESESRIGIRHNAKPDNESLCGNF